MDSLLIIRAIPPRNNSVVSEPSTCFSVRIEMSDQQNRSFTPYYVNVFPPAIVTKRFPCSLRIASSGRLGCCQLGHTAGFRCALLMLLRKSLLLLQWFSVTSCGISPLDDQLILPLYNSLYLLGSHSPVRIILRIVGDIAAIPLHPKLG